MEDYLRLGLLLIAGLIVFFILLETWSSRRRLKLARLETKYMTSNLSADEVLGLGPREPKIIHPEQLSLDGECLAVKPMPIAKDSECLAIKPTPIAKDGECLAVKPTPIIKDGECLAEKPTPIAKVEKIIKTPSNDEESAELVKSKETQTSDDITKSLLSLNVFAKPGQQFFSYDLLQAISGAGMQFGEMSIFHYYQLTPEGRVSLFSLASATKPGYFDLDRIGDFSCAGLILFANLQEVPDPQVAFNAMLKVAEQLAEDLDGELRANPRTPWNSTVLNQYQQKVARYQTMKYSVFPL